MNDQNTADEIIEELSPGALRQRRFRAHNRNDHRYCLPEKCAEAAAAPARQAALEAAGEAVRAEWEQRMQRASRTGETDTADKLVVGIPGLKVYPDGDPSEAERENPKPGPDRNSLLGTLARLPRDSGGFGSPSDRKVETIRQAIEAFGVTAPHQVYEAAAQYNVACQRQAAIQNVTARRFTADDLTADDWLARLDEAAIERLQRQNTTLQPVIREAVEQAARKLKSAVSAALPEVVMQVEEWLEANQRNLAIYTGGGGDITPNQEAQWKGRADQVWRFAERQAEVSGGGRVAELPYAAEAWLLLWDWTPEQWAELVDLTRPGRELRPGDTFYGVALKVGAVVRFARSVRELKDRYNRLTPQRSSFYGSTPR